MSLVHNQQSAVLLANGTGFLPISGLGVNDANVGHGGLSQQARNVAIFEHFLERFEVVELNLENSNEQVNKPIEMS
jgi:hypothetical protein